MKGQNLAPRGAKEEPKCQYGSNAYSAFFHILISNLQNAALFHVYLIILLFCRLHMVKHAMFAQQNVPTRKLDSKKSTEQFLSRRPFPSK